MMRNFNTLTGAHAVNGVYSGYVAPTYGLDADLPFWPFADQTFPAVTSAVFQRPAFGFGKGFGQSQRGAARGIFLHVVVQFQHVHIIAVAEHMHQLRKQFQQHIDAHAHIGGKKYGSFARQIFQFPFFCFAQAGSADDNGTAVFCRDAGVLHSGTRRGEVNDDRMRSGGKKGVKLCGHGAFHSCDVGSARPFQQAGKCQVVRLPNQRGNERTHTARSSGDNDRNRHEKLLLPPRRLRARRERIG